jgi:CHASE2 domain-containing sensor protein/class 3 adenylate cyclase
MAGAATGRWRRRRGLGRGLVAAHLAWALVLALEFMGALQAPALWLHDRLIQVRAGRAPSADIALVLMREADVRRFGWPLPDGTLAALLERLAELGAGPVGVALFRDLPQPPGSDALADIASAAADIAWVARLTGPEAQRVAPPFFLAGADAAGTFALAVVPADPGGVVRRGLLVGSDPRSGANHLGLGAALATRILGHLPEALDEAGERIALRGREVPLVKTRGAPYGKADAGGYQILLDFAAGAAGFPDISLGEVLAGEGAAMLRGRAVVIGIEAPSVRDGFTTPLSAARGAGALDSSAVLHAHVADQLLRLARGHSVGLRPLPPWAEPLAAWLAALLGAALAYRVIRPLRALATLVVGLGALAAIGHLAFGMAVLLPLVPAGLAAALAAIATLSVLNAAGVQERRQLRRSFDSYLDPAIIDELLAESEGPRLGGEQRDITVLFSDLAGFTALAETLPPAQMATLLNNYFEVLALAVTRAGGLVAEFAGDGMLALFGAPQRQPDHAERAVNAALAIDAAAEAFRAAQQAAGVAWGATRIGVHSGQALVGNIGTRSRLKYGAVGDVLNTASRIEALNKQVGTRVLVSAGTAARCETHLLRPIGVFLIRGKAQPIELGVPAPRSAAALAHIEAYELLRADPEAGRARLLGLAAASPDDPALAYLARQIRAGADLLAMVP